MRIRAHWFFMVLAIGLASLVTACGGDDDDDDDDDDDADAETECVDGCVDNGDGTMTCECLMWKTEDNGAPSTWDDARDWAEGLDFADRSGWRLATVDELEALYDPGRTFTTSIGTPAYIMDPFIVTMPDIWSGDLEPADESRAYYVSYFLDTGVYTASTIRTSSGGQSALAVLDLE